MPNCPPRPKVETTTAVPSSDADAQQQAALIQALRLTVQHFFGGFSRLFGPVPDPRHPMYITYPLVALLTAGVSFMRMRSIKSIPWPWYNAWKAHPRPEVFNTQKNGGFALEHAYSKDPVASKVFYFLLQVAHVLFQLMKKGSLFRKAFPAGVGAAKNLAFRLLEARPNLRLSLEQIQAILTVLVQIRFDTS
jgi:hypothetical protein